MVLAQIKRRVLHPFSAGRWKTEEYHLIRSSRAAQREISVDIISQRNHLQKPKLVQMNTFVKSKNPYSTEGYNFDHVDTECLVC